MKKKTIVYLILIGTVLLFLNGCMILHTYTIYKMLGIPLKAYSIGSGINSVSSAYDGRHYVVNYCDKNKSLIAVGDYKTDEIKVILSSNDGTIYLRPIFSRDDKKIIFINRRVLDKSTLYIMNSDGSEVTRLTDDILDTNNILDIALSRDGKKIYYVNSRKYTRYSPVGDYAEHENDIYSISIDSREIERITHDNSYGFSDIVVSRDGKKIFTLWEILYLEEKTSKESRFKVLEGLGFSKKNLVYSTGYPISQVSSDNKLILSYAKVDSFHKDTVTGKEEWFTADGYGLYLATVPDRVIIKEILYLPAYLTCPTILEKEGVVLFVRSDMSGKRKKIRELWAVNLDGTNLRQIEVNIQ